MTTSEDHEFSDPPPDAEALKLIAALRPEQVQAIDAAVMRAAGRNWRKVAFVVGTAMGTLPELAPGIPDVFYTQRVISLVSQGRLESQGDLSRMRYSEVRIPRQAGEA
ncbi:DUF3658 domain-containing protein [Marilutibacter alkalisoli]|uniref:DUF3658 domain-containing protein n=1 Tax=Marilutibacter alkalisoli TaxID=2591633 RepID=A0A514BSC2_9GAMM|nr:hypothetical protein FKV23_07305 [Lysobacter alkalisoli]